MTKTYFSKKHFTGAAFALALASCNSTDQAAVTETLKDTLTSAITEEPVVEDLPLDSTLFELPLEINNENIDTYFDETVDKPLSSSQIDALGLKSLEETDGKDFYVLGEIPLSETLKTRLVFRNNGWNEWVMWLVSYDTNDYKLGDVEILYGDNVEGLMERTCTISKDGMISTQKINYGFETDAQTGIEEIFSLVDSGVFLKITESDLSFN